MLGQDRGLRGVDKHTDFAAIHSGAFLNDLGLTQYQAVFANLKRAEISALCMSHLPKLGITQFSHQKAIMVCDICVDVELCLV